MKLRSSLARRTLFLSAGIICVALLAASAQAQFQWSERIANSTTFPEGPTVGMSLDANGNIYVTGWFDGTNNFGGVTLTNNNIGAEDIFVAKYTATGALQWVQQAGGNSGNEDLGRGVGVDTNGNVYVTGVFNSPATFGTSNMPTTLNGEFFLAKYDNAGAVQWVQQGTGGMGNGLAVDGAGNSYALVSAGNGDTITFGSINVSTPSDFDSNYDASTILVKYDNTGTVQWATVMGGYGETLAHGVAMDAAGNVYVTGQFDGNIAIGTSNLLLSGGSTENMFIARFNNAGALTWVQQATGGNVGGVGVAVDQVENVYVAGSFGTSIDLSGISLTNVGSSAAFIAKYNSSGAIQWARQAGGSNANSYFDVALDGQGNVYPAGYLNSTAAIAKYDSAGTLQWTYSASGSPPSQISLATKCAVDSGGHCYLAGWYQGTATFGTNPLQPQETWNFFIAAPVTNSTIQFTASPTSGLPPLTVRFNSTNVDTSGNAVTIWNWNFGDGGTSTAQNPSHTYTNPDTFNPSFVATNSLGAAVIGYGPQIAVLPPTFPSNFTFTTNNGAITITGYTGSGGPVVIPSMINGLSVTSIGTNAFEGLTNVYSLTLPDTVTSIGSEAFESCTSLTSVTIPGSVASIGAAAFANCSDLTNATISLGVMDIESNAFNSCVTLATVTIPGSVASIGAAAFANCSNLTNATISFGLTDIESNAFYDCGSLVSAAIPPGVTNVGDYAFQYCSLSAVTIPASVTTIGVDPFGGSGTVTAINVTAGNPDYTSVNGVLFNLDQTELIQFPSAVGGNYTIPGTVTSIGTGAFDSCYFLASVAIPQSVLSVGDQAFLYCEGLGNIAIPNSVTNLGFETFVYCSSMTNVTIDNGVTSIEYGVFDECRSLTTVTIGSSVTNIGGYAFGFCPLTAVYFQGNAPGTGPIDPPFEGGASPLIYYLPATTGWGTTFSGFPTVELENAILTATPTNGLVPLTVNFTSASVDAFGNAISGRKWIFGDGSTSAAQNPSHTYTNMGTFTAILLETNIHGLLLGAAPVPITVSPITVSFTANPTNGPVPLTVNFTSAGVDALGRTITNWFWRFGDGFISRARNPTHVYALPGSYTPTLLTSNNLSESIPGSGPDLITVNPIAPVYSGLVLNGGFETGDFTGWTLGGTANYALVDDGYYSGILPYSGNFDAALETSGALGYLSQTLATTTGERYLLSFWFDNPYLDPSRLLVSWNGTNLFDTINPSETNWTEVQFIVTATGSSTVLQFGFEDDYDYLLLDAIAVASNYVQFTATPTNGPVPLIVQFSAPTVDKEGHAIVSWWWDFGDGSTSTVQNPLHVYNSGNTFFSTLTATNNLGGTVASFGPAITATNGLIYSGLVLNGGFATGNFTGWTLSGDTNATFVDNGTSTGIPPYPGSFDAILATSGAPGTLSQTLSTTAGASYLLSFWVDNPYSDPPQFLVSWNGTNLLDTSDLVATNWTHVEFLVEATGSNSVLQFKYEDGYNFILLDQVEVESNYVQYTATPTIGAPPLTTYFTSPSMDNHSNAITSWYWVFGDGSTSEAQNPAQVYTNGGIFQPILVAENNLGEAVYGFGPLAITSVSGLVYSGLVANGGFETGDFTGWTLSGDTSDTFVDDGSRTGFTPYAGNDEAALGTSGSLGYLSQTLSTTPGASYSLSFWFNNPDMDPGEFLVSWNGDTLLDTTSLSETNWTEMEFVVSATGSNSVLQFGFQDENFDLFLDAVDVESNFVLFTATPTNGPTPLTVDFTSPSVDREGHPITSWFWNFGDGATSTVQNPSHVYETAGAFFPTLMVSNNVGGTPGAAGPAPIVAALSAFDPMNFSIQTTGQTVHKADFNVTGTAVDYLAVAAVYYQLNGGAWQLATTVNNWSNWTASVTLAVGANVISAYAMDTTGNVSETNSVDVDYVLTSPLTLLINGDGSVKPNLNGKSLDIGQSYGLSAIPAEGSGFINWTGGTNGTLAFLSSSPTLKFTMVSNLVLQANFGVQPGIASFSLSGTNLVLNATDGQAGGTYYLIMSTNLALPLSQWTPVATNVLGAAGNFTITATNTVTHGVPQRFYILKTP